jgi:hypothetical protein
MKVSLVKEESYGRGDQKEVYREVKDRAKEKMMEVQEANKRRKTDSIVTNKDFVRIILSNPNNTEIMQSVFVDPSIVKKDQGPGSYNIETASEKCKKRNASVVDWSKVSGGRFRQKRNRNPGPGAYEP